MQNIKIIETIPREIILGIFVGLVGLVIGLIKRTYNRDIKKIEEQSRENKEGLKDIMKKLDEMAKDLRTKGENERSWRIEDNKELRKELDKVKEKLSKVDIIEKRCEERYKK